MPTQLSDLHNMYHRLRGAQSSLLQKKQTLQSEIAALEAKNAESQKVIAVFQQLVDAEIASAVKAVETLLTDGLQTVFHDQDLSVTAETDIVRGKVSVQLVTNHKHSDGRVTSGSTLDSFGGAVSTLQSVLLRLLVVVSKGLRPILLLDETLPALDSMYVAAVGKFLEVLAERMKVDILLVTHNQTLFDCAPKAYKIRATNNGAVFDEVRK